MSSLAFAARNHHKFLELGFELPDYTYESEAADSASLGFALWWYCTATLQTDDGPLSAVEKSSSKKLAKQEASERLMQKVLRTGCLAPGKPPPPQPELRRDGFLARAPVRMFSPGEVKELKDFVRPLGLEYVYEAVRHYEYASRLPTNMTAACSRAEVRESQSPAGSSPASHSCSSRQSSAPPEFAPTELAPSIPPPPPSRRLRPCRWCGCKTYVGKGLCTNGSCRGH